MKPRRLDSDTSFSIVTMSATAGDGNRAPPLTGTGDFGPYDSVDAHLRVPLR